MDSTPDVFYTNGVFLIYSQQDAMVLRRKRILGHHIGCAVKNPHQVVTSGLPYLINHYAANIVFLNRLANFKKFNLKRLSSLEDREGLCSQRLSLIQDEARRSLEEKRSKELKKRNIELSPSRSKQFDEKKLRIHVEINLETECSSYESTIIDPSDLFIFTDHKMIVFKDLYDRGFFVSSGMKFGSDFLVYLGDPVRYHAQYAVRVVANINDGVDLTRLKYNEINALHRLCHTANKTCLLATVCQSCEVKYWTLGSRVYLSVDSSNTIFKSIDPRLNPI